MVTVYRSGIASVSSNLITSKPYPWVFSFYPEPRQKVVTVKILVILAHALFYSCDSISFFGRGPPVVWPMGRNWN